MKRLLQGTLLVGCLLVTACRQPPAPEVVAAVQAEQEPSRKAGRWTIGFRWRDDPGHACWLLI